MKTYFSTNPSFQLVETYLLSSGSSMLLFGAFLLLLEAMIEIRGNQFYQKNIFLLVGIIFDFLTEEAVFPYSANLLFNECSIPCSANRTSG